MGLETATYINGLVATNPVGATDPKSQGDDHLRLLKSTILATFAGITGAVTSTHTELNYLHGLTGVTGTGNLVASASPTLTGTVTAATINASSLGTSPLNASNASSGTLPDARLSTNVPLKNASNIFTASPQHVQAASTSSFAYLSLDNSTGVRSTELGYTGTAASPAYGEAAGSSWLNASSGAFTLSVADAPRMNFKGAQDLYFPNGKDFIFGASAASSATSNRGNIELHGVTDAIIRFYSGATNSGYLYADGSNNVTLLAYNTLKLYTNNGSSGAITINTDGSVTTQNVNASEFGYKGAPRRSVTATDSTQAADLGKLIYINGTTAAQTFTLNANPPADTLLEILNVSNQSWTIACSGTLTHIGGSTGSGTLNANTCGRYYHQGSGNWFQLA